MILENAIECYKHFLTQDLGIEIVSSCLTRDTADINSYTLLVIFPFETFNEYPTGKFFQMS